VSRTMLAICDECHILHLLTFELWNSFSEQMWYHGWQISLRAGKIHLQCPDCRRRRSLRQRCRTHPRPFSLERSEE
jgi:predicted RNA-binding Zn-ribbon protein involved in translation (DUF1610 family)